MQATEADSAKLIGTAPRAERGAVVRWRVSPGAGGGVSHGSRERWARGDGSGVSRGVSGTVPDHNVVSVPLGGGSYRIG